jgi:methyl-accepting chemotaxis protein
MKLSIRKKLMVGFFALMGMILIMGVIGANQMNRMLERTVYIQSNTVMSLDRVDVLRQQIGDYRRLQFQHVVANTVQIKDTYEKQMATLAKNTADQFASYQTELASDAQEKALIEAVQANWLKYLEQSDAYTVASRHMNTDAAVKVLNGDAGATFDQLNAKMADWKGYNANLAALSVDESRTMNTNGMITFLVIGGISLLLAVFIALNLSGAFSRGVKQMVQAADQITTADLAALEAATQRLAAGDLTQRLSFTTQPLKYRSNDELGDLAQRFNQMIDHLRQTGQSFDQMIQAQREAMQEVARSAVNLNDSSEQLTVAASQAGEAAAQIAATIQQVAKGTTQQTESVSRTAGAIEQMTRAIDGVSRGAAEQADAVVRASTVTGQLSTAIDEIAGNVQRQASGAAQTARTAHSSAETVNRTIQGMERIRSKVSQSAEKVQEMGQHSDQIGMIVETIDDIASQTNLLALNAAIEAARAGEHGKGFAVVADEVRKLAEKSALATKEIGGLIREIQRTVGEAVQTMSESAQEVEAGVGLANQSGASLSAILESAQDGLKLGELIAASAEQMRTLSADLVNAMDSVSAVVEENTAATQEMASGSADVTQAIENIASVSEENSAAVEEASAGAEEMSAQVEEVTASAQSLSQMAAALQTLVGRYQYA